MREGSGRMSFGSSLLQDVGGWRSSPSDRDVARDGARSGRTDPAVFGPGAVAELPAVLDGVAPANSRVLAPVAAIVDPELTIGVPLAQLASSALDALTQGAEGAWSTSSTPASIASGLAAVALVAHAYHDAIRDPSDLRVRTSLSLAGL